MISPHLIPGAVMAGVDWSGRGQGAAAAALQRSWWFVKFYNYERIIFFSPEKIIFS